MARSTVIADASWCPQTRAGGWAVWININYEDGRHERIQKSGTFNQHPKSSEHAEQLACMNGIFIAYQNGARDILVQTDCKAIVDKQGYKGPGSAREFRMATVDYWPAAVLRWRHIKGHNLNNVNDRRTYVNDWCDREAKKHMRKWRERLRYAESTSL